MPDVSPHIFCFYPLYTVLLLPCVGPAPGCQASASKSEAGTPPVLAVRGSASGRKPSITGEIDFNDINTVPAPFCRTAVKDPTENGANRTCPDVHHPPSRALKTQPKSRRTRGPFTMVKEERN